MTPDDLEAVGAAEHTGFPNAATDRSLSSLDLAKLLVKNPSSTFFMRVRGGSGDAHGIFDNDIVVIDRALVPKKSDLVIWWEDETFAIGRLRSVPKDVVCWGVVVYVIHGFRG